MGTKRSGPGAIHRRIVEVMKRFPEGITAGQIRQELQKEGLKPDEQTHLDRRKRDLKKWFRIETLDGEKTAGGKKRSSKKYKYIGLRSEVIDEGDISIKLKAEVRHAAHGRCQMCGRTIAEDGIKLVVDHKIPRNWGGSNDRSNLWAICEECNAGKKDYFASLDVDSETMKRITAYTSVHVRIGELLKAVGVGNKVPSSLIEVVANQDDWHKRLRELRYPAIGWRIDPQRYKKRGREARRRLRAKELRGVASRSF